MKLITLDTNLTYRMHRVGKGYARPESNPDAPRSIDLLSSSFHNEMVMSPIAHSLPDAACIIRRATGLVTISTRTSSALSYTLKPCRRDYPRGVGVPGASELY